MEQDKDIDVTKIGSVFQSIKLEPDKVKKEYERIFGKNKFKGESK